MSWTLLIGLLAALLQSSPTLAALRVAVISDLNGAYGSTDYDDAVRYSVSGVISSHPDLVISTGDMVAGQRTRPPLRQDELRSMWSAFHQTVTEPLRNAGIPLAVTPGNHDASAYPAFEQERRVFSGAWQGRNDQLEMIEGSGYPFDYAFALRDVLFVSLDVTRIGPVPEAQKQWLDQLLGKWGARYAYRVVFSHLPIFPVALGRENEATGDMELEQILRKHAVDLYLSGHHHAFYPGYRDGIRHISQACLGAGPRRLIGQSRASVRAVTFLLFDEQGIAVTALTGPELTTPIAIESLPETVTTRHGTLIRDDLRP